MFGAFIGLESQQKPGVEVLSFQFGWRRRNGFPNVNSRSEAERAMKLGSGRNQQRWRRDSNYQMILAVQLDGSAHEVRISPVTPPPQRVTDDDHFVRARRLFFRSESPAERRRDSEEIKEIHRDTSAAYSLRFAIPGQIPSARLQGGDCRKRSVRPTPLQVILDASGNAQAPLRYADLDGVYPFRFGIWKRLQQSGVDDAEHRGVGADAQRQRERGRGGEAGSLEQHSRAIPQVLPEFFEASEPRDVTISFSSLFDSAETQQRRAPRLFLAHPSAEVLRRFHLQMELQFAIQRAFDIPAAQARAQAMK